MKKTSTSIHSLQWMVTPIILAIVALASCRQYDVVQDIVEQGLQYKPGSKLEARRNSTTAVYQQGKGVFKLEFSEFAFSTPERRKILRDEIYSKMWDPEILFDDPEVVELCFCLRREDYSAAEEIISRREEIVNAQSKYGMRLIHWSIFLDPVAFEFLLERKTETDFFVESFYDVFDSENLSFDNSRKTYDEYRKSYVSFLTLLALHGSSEIHPGTRYFNDLRLLLIKNGTDSNYGDSSILKHKQFDGMAQALGLINIANGRYNAYSYDFDNKLRKPIAIVMNKPNQ